MNPAVIEDLCRENLLYGRPTQLHLSINGQTEGWQEKIYRAHSKSAKHHFKDSKNKHKKQINTDTHTKNYVRQAQHTVTMCYGGFSLW